MTTLQAKTFSKKTYKVTPNGGIQVDVGRLVKNPEVQKIFRKAHRIVECQQKKSPLS